MNPTQIAIALSILAVPSWSFAASVEKEVTNCFEAIKPWDELNRLDARKVEVDGRKAYVMKDGNTVLAFDEYTHSFGSSPPGKGFGNLARGRSLRFSEAVG